MVEASITEKIKIVKKFDWRDWFVFFILGALIIVFALLSDKFFQFENFASIGRQTAMISMIAFGMTFVITTGNIDLSVGSIVGLVGVITALALRAGVGVFESSVIGMVMGMVIGLVNGLLTTKVNIPSFLVTLGIMQMARGLALTVTNTKAVSIINNSFTRIWGAGTLLGFPASIIWTLLFFGICIWLYHYTYFGNYVKAVGGNRTAATYSGIKVDRITILSFVISGFLAAVAGLLMAARLKGGRPEVGAGMELDAIAAVILGGTALYGGRGKILNTLVGSLIMGVIVNGLIILGVQSNIQQIIKGAIIIATYNPGSSI